MHPTDSRVSATSPRWKIWCRRNVLPRLFDRLLTHVVHPGGRLIVSSYTNRDEPPRRFAKDLRDVGTRPGRDHPHRPARRSAVVDLLAGRLTCIGLRLELSPPVLPASNHLPSLVRAHVTISMSRKLAWLTSHWI